MLSRTFLSVFSRSTVVRYINLIHLLWFTRRKPFQRHENVILSDTDHRHRRCSSLHFAALYFRHPWCRGSTPVLATAPWSGSILYTHVRFGVPNAAMGLR
ncbi:hypothetical protein EVAR_103181_1 [Eumeta japonica]|uniref:Uncharacterized protein n=1 Tax=Eumeta variegata TaxID=151549 RepID=A0A4C1YGF8_EUMVA|nr:hypothetical protein EVAR_103181_1 [Eumeta japonica]